MSTHDTHSAAVPVDEAWIRDWAAEGLAAIQRYLSKHAAFAAYLEARTVLESSDGDGAVPR